MVYFFVSIILILIFFFILHIMLKSDFSIGYNTRLKEAQLIVLAKIALKQGVSEKEIEEVLNDTLAFSNKQLRESKIISKYFK